MTYSIASQAQCIYILDTNILIHDPEVLFKFEHVHVGIPMVVLEELDIVKKETTEAGRNARIAIRYLDDIATRGSLKEGVVLDNQSTIYVLWDDDTDADMKEQFPLKMDVNDHRIIFVAFELQKRGYRVCFISKDINARLKAHAIGIEVQDYFKQSLVAQDTVDKGWIRVNVPAIQLKKEMPLILSELAQSQELSINQFVLLESNHNPLHYKIYRYLGAREFKQVMPTLSNWSLQPRNPQQSMALDLLLDETVQLVSLCGPAGTGKTFLALLAGLHKVIVEDAYEKMLISRPVVPLGRDLGYLPGTLEEKLHSWMLPIYDNMEFIFHTMGIPQHLAYVKAEQKGRGNRGRREYKQSYESGINGMRSINDLIENNKLSLEAITYMRGRSIPYRYIIIDEVQNLSPHEVKTLISRVGQDSKIVLTGDPYQIDTAMLDFSSNGLVIASERFRGQSLFGSVYLETSERSKLSELAGQLI